MSRVPRIRFKGFEEDWEQRKFGELFLEKRDKTEREDEDILLSCAITGIYLNSEMFSHFRGTSNIGYLKIKKNDLILSAQNLHLGNANVNLLFEHGIISPAYKVYELNKCDQYFVQSWVKKDSTKDFFLNATTEGASQCRKNIDWCILNNQLIAIPSLYEQIRLGKIFHCLNHLITLHQSKSFGHILEAIVSCTLSWEQRKFSEIALRVSNLWLSSSDLPCVEYEDVVSEAGILNNDIRSKKVVKAGILFDDTHVLYGKLRPYLHNWLCPNFSGVAVGDWWVLKPCYVAREFIYRIIQTKRFDNATNQSSGSKMPRADWNLVSNTEFMISSDSSEQEKIGLYFKKLDHLITLHQLEPFQMIFKAIAYRIIDYAKSKPPIWIKYEDII